MDRDLALTDLLAHCRKVLAELQAVSMASTSQFQICLLDEIGLIEAGLRTNTSGGLFTGEQVEQGAKRIGYVNQ